MLDFATSSTFVWTGISQLLAFLFLIAAIIKFWEYIAESLIGKAKSK
ncbi:MAG: hypothetical protein LBG89_00215 [Rickettsiales bacterium]|nr:hypothetical protein [Rickettsiales bacterium]